MIPLSKRLQRLRNDLDAGGRTQLGVGPMSRQCVDAVVDLANSCQTPLMLIASRRQIECEAQGGGYVENWTTEAFSEYVRQRDRGGYVLLCRDHGGPWQNYLEVQENMDLDAAMASAKVSFEADISSGFDIIHLDPSIDIHTDDVAQEDILERLFDLYDFCMDVAEREQKSIAIEIGSEEQSGVDQNLDVLENTLDATRTFCVHRGYPFPWFIVAQTGTLVKETKNVGTFDDPFRRPGEVPAEILVPRVIDMCEKAGISLKEHNCDYLSNDALSWHPRLKIHAANIAPEFGVAQTRHIFRLCREFGLDNEFGAFAELSYNSRKWEKWMLPGTDATDHDRAVIAGHYVFATAEFEEIYEAIRLACHLRGVDLEASITDAVKISIMRIMTCFNLNR